MEIQLSPEMVKAYRLASLGRECQLILGERTLRKITNLSMADFETVYSLLHELHLENEANRGGVNN